MTGSGHPTQKPPVISEWVGYWVFVSYISGPNLDPEEPAKPVRDRPEAVTASFLLEDYGELGIEVKRNLADPTIFMSWGAVGFCFFVSHIRPPNRARREPAKPVGDSRGPVTASFLLEDYGELGIEVKRNLADPTIFMSWGAVLYVQGPPPEVREQIDRE